MRAGGLEARYLAAADGLHSPIRRQLGLDRPTNGGRRWSIRRHFQIAPWTDTVEVYWAAHTEAYVTPVADDCVGVAILTSRQGKFDDHLRNLPLWQHDSPGHRALGPRAAGPLRQRASSQHRGRVMLVGDAAGIRRRPYRRGPRHRTGMRGTGGQFGAGRRPGGLHPAVAPHVSAVPAADVGTADGQQLAGARGMIVPAATTLPSVFNQAVKLLAQ